MKFPLLCAFSLGALCPAWAAPAPQSLPPQTRIEIERLLRHPGLQSGRVGVAIVALGQAKTPAQFPATPYDGGAQPLLFGRDETKRFTPASNFKLFTATWVLKTLGPNAVFETQVLGAPADFLAEGSWPVNEKPPLVVTLVGGGDPSLSSADLTDLARQVTAPIQKEQNYFIVRAQASPAGDLLNAETGGRRYPDGWTLDDALWYYGPPVGGLAINRNQVDVTVTGAQAGELAVATSDPSAPFPIFSTVQTVAKDDPRAGLLQWDRGDAASPLSETLWLRGFIAAGAKATEGIAVPDPLGWAGALFAADLKAQGGQIAQINGGYTTDTASVLAVHQSKPVGVLLRQFLKTSDNLYGEMLLRRAGATLPGDAPIPPTAGAQVSSTGLAARAHRDLIGWLIQNKVPTQGLRFSDGSGLSRYDTATPISIARLLGVAQKLNGGAMFYDALPIAGVDGTLKNRFKGSAAENNLRAKTGTFSITNCLSGYVTTRDGQRLAVSILTNFIEDGELARRWQGRVMATLAAASWKE